MLAATLRKLSNTQTSVSDGRGYSRDHMRSAASHLRDPQTNCFLSSRIYGCLVDCVNQIILKSIILTGR